MGKTTKQQKLQWLVLALILAVCAVAALVLYWPREPAEGTVAVISVDGTDYRSIPLWSAKDELFSIQADTGKPVSFEIKDHAIRFVQVTCPDHVCEKAGWCDSPGERAVCLPNRTALVCYDKNERTEKISP